jgi:hypothetical protein
MSLIARPHRVFSEDVRPNERSERYKRLAGRAKARGVDCFLYMGDDNPNTFGIYQAFASNSQTQSCMARTASASPQWYARGHPRTADEPQAARQPARLVLDRRQRRHQPDRLRRLQVRARRTDPPQSRRTGHPEEERRDPAPAQVAHGPVRCARRCPVAGGAQKRRGRYSGTSSSVTPRPPPRRAIDCAGSGGGGRYVSRSRS